MTDERLKQALAKMLPGYIYDTKGMGVRWLLNGAEVLDTELLHLCALVEQELAKNKWTWLPYANELNEICADEWHCSSIRATWQQRVTALAKVKGIEL